MGDECRIGDGLQDRDCDGEGPLLSGPKGSEVIPVGVRGTISNQV